tara:strand:- start:339 stop:701 length:363 start_codon:yes stop_codon:yes gene_type:complete
MKEYPFRITVSKFTPQKLELSLYLESNKHLGVDLDFGSVCLFKEQLVAILSRYKNQLPTCATLSLKQVAFIDAEGLFSCVQMNNLFKKHGCMLVFNDVPFDVFRLFKITKLDKKVNLLLS